MDLLYYGTLSLRKSKKSATPDVHPETESPTKRKRVESSEFYEISLGERDTQGRRFRNSSTLEDMNKFHSLIEIDRSTLSKLDERHPVPSHSDATDRSHWKNSSLFKVPMAANEDNRKDVNVIPGEISTPGNESDSISVKLVNIN